MHKRLLMEVFKFLKIIKLSLNFAIVLTFQIFSMLVSLKLDLIFMRTEQAFVSN